MKTGGGRLKSSGKSETIHFLLIPKKSKRLNFYSTFEAKHSAGNTPALFVYGLLRALRCVLLSGIRIQEAANQRGNDGESRVKSP